MRLLFVFAALAVTLTGLWLSALTGEWLFRHVAPYVYSGWFAPACAIFTTLCAAFGAFIAVRSRRPL